MCAVSPLPGSLKTTDGIAPAAVNIDRFRGGERTPKPSATEDWGRSPAFALRGVTGYRLIFLRPRETICDERQETEFE